MSQLNVDSIKDRTGADQPDIVGVAKAFVNFNGTGTVAIRSAFNVSSITDNGTGDYTVNFTNAMVDADYSFSANGRISTTSTNGDFPLIGAYRADTYLTTSLRIWSVFRGSATTPTASADPDIVAVTIHSN